MDAVPTHPAATTLQGSTTPLVDDRYRAILHGMPQAFCVLEVLFDAQGIAVDYRFLEVNAAFAQQTTLGNPVGRTMRELAPQHEDHWYQLYGEVVRTGQPAHFEQQAKYIGDYWYEVYALPTGPPGGPQVAVLFTSITARRRAEQDLRRNQDSQAFLLRLADALRPLATPAAIAEAACRLLVAQLAASRAQYTLVTGEPGAEQGQVHGEYVAHGPPMPRHYPLGSYGEPLVARLRAGETLVLTDTAHDPQLTASQRVAFAAAASPAAIAVPLIKQGRLAAALTVHAATPRQWEPHEVRLAQDVAERIWAAVERVRAEEALHKLEEQFHLFVLASSDVVYKMSADWQRMLYLNGKNFLVDTTTPRSTWLESYIPPADQAAVGAAIQAAIAGKHFFELEHRVIQTDGSVGWTFSRALPVLGPQGELEGWFGTATDITPHKLAQEALRHSEAQFRAVANLVPSMLWRSDAQSETTWYNQQWLDYTGQTLEEALGYGWTEVIHPSDRAQSARRYREAVLRGQPLRQEHRIRAATGEYRWFQVQVLPYYDEQGIITQWFGAATDIHERRLAEEVLRENERRLEQQVAARVGELRASHDLLQSVFDTNLVVMSVMQAVRDEAGEVQDFRIKLVNKQMEKETGRTDLVGKLYGQEYPGVRVVGVFELMLRALATGEPQGMEHYYNHEGFAQWFSCLFVKLDDGLVVTNLDITQRKVAEQERTRNMQLLEQAESAAQLGSWEYDLATSHFHWSAGMYQLFGLPLGHPVKPSIYLDYVVAEDRALAEQLVQRLTAGAGDLEQTLRLRVGGQQKTVRIKAAGLPSGPGQPERVLGVNLDISELQRLEADNLRLRLSQQQALFEAIQAAEEQERRRMSESLHNGIGQLLYATKLQLDRLPPAAAPSPLYKAAHLLSEAIRQTRSLSHELTPAILEEFGLEATLQSICRALSTPALHWHCHLVFDGQPALPPPLQLAVYRLAQELAQNVAKHAQASEATLEVEVLPAWVVLRVEDNGRGFDHGRTQDGLGLRSLRGRVTLLGGHVYLTTSPDQGTQCQIRLPLSPLAP